MTRIHSLLVFVSFLSPTIAYWKGFNIAAELPSGACKSTADWTKDFTTMAALPSGFNSARLFSSSDCDSLANAVPAAIAANIKLMVGLWTRPANHYDEEKFALLAAIKQYGHDWIVSVSVGSEDLFRGDISASGLASQIYEVKYMLSTVGASSIQVGHVDIPTMWTDSANAALIQASDFVGTQPYPYYGYAKVSDGYNVFWDIMATVRDVVENVKPGTRVWITETGWPVSGSTMGGAVPSVDNAAAYWNSVACSAFEQTDTFWFLLQDNANSLSFGVLDANFNPLYDLRC